MNRESEIDEMRLDDWMQPDVVLPAQFYADSGAVRDPERQLRIAVLRDAIRCFQRYLDSSDRRERMLYEDAVDWISSADRSEPFSFENVCDALRLDPDYLRQRLGRWQEAERARVAPRAASSSAARPRTRRKVGWHLQAA